MVVPGIKIPWQVFACAGLVAVLWGYGAWQHHRGAASVQKKWDESIATGRVIVQGMKDKQKLLTEKVELLTDAKVKVIYEKGETIVKQVEVLIPDDSCELPGGFRLLHDAAATSTLPDASQADYADGVPAQDAARTVAENYTTCNAAIADLAGLRQWAKEQEKLYLDQCKASPDLCSADTQE